MRNDASAIGGVGYEFAVALLRNGKPRQADEQTRRTRLELQRRFARPFAELFVVESVAAYRKRFGTVHHDLARQLSELVVVDDRGIYRLDDIDLTMGTHGREIYSASTGDFASVRGHCQSKAIAPASAAIPSLGLGIK